MVVDLVVNKLDKILDRKLQFIHNFISFMLENKLFLEITLTLLSSGVFVLNHTETVLLYFVKLYDGIMAYNLL